MLFRSNFLARLTIETTINGGIAKVTGAKNSPKLKPETVQRRTNVEREVAMLWEGVTRQKDLYQVLCEADGISAELEKVRKVMIVAFEEYKKKTSQPAEFLKQTALATGVWIKPDSFANDISRLLSAVNENEVSANDKVRLMTMRKAKIGRASCRERV